MSRKKVQLWWIIAKTVWWWNALAGIMLLMQVCTSALECHIFYRVTKQEHAYTCNYRTQVLFQVCSEQATINKLLLEAMTIIISIAQLVAYSLCDVTCMKHTHTMITMYTQIQRNLPICLILT